MLSVTLHLRHCWEEKTGNFTRVRQCRQRFVLEKTSKNQNDYMENAHQKEESFFPFGISQRTFCSAAGQLSSFRVACVAGRISSRNKLKFF